MLGLLCLAVVADPLRAGFLNPPPEARTRAYWWWLNGNVTKASIKRDLDEMAAKGFGGAVIVDAGGAEQRENVQVPHGPTFASPAWRELFRFTIAEAKRVGIELSLNIQSGWNLGGPMVKAFDAPKKLVWSETIVGGTLTPGGGEGGRVPLGAIKLPEPKHDPAFYQDVAVVAYPVREDYDPAKRATLSDWEQKALLKPLSFSAPKTDGLVTDSPDIPGEEATRSKAVLDLSKRLRPDGTLDWTPRSGRWELLRIGATLNDHSRVSTNSEGWDGYAIDPFDKGAFDRYWNAVVEPLVADAGKEAGRTLKYLHTDSWEVEVANWTPALFSEFRKRRGYDLRPFLPALTGRIVDGRSETNAVLNDLRRTMGDLAIANHYAPFRQYAHRHGLLIHPESGGPHAVPIDSLQCLGYDDAPMSEFWAGSWTHRVKEEDRFFVKQPASAAHTYGRRYVLAEGFTTIGPHWQETIWDNLRPNFDRALCEGMNRLVWHAFVNSPESEGLPGQQYFAGTYLNPNVTWWSQSKPFFDYLNRCQFMLQQGSPVADVIAYYGDHVPNFAQLRKSDPAGIGEGYDYDAATMENVLALRYSGGFLRLPGGMRYRVLSLPDREAISLPVLRKVRDLVRGGATVVGRRPTRSTSLGGDAEVLRIAEELWGSGRVKLLPARAALAVPPDFEGTGLGYVHRQVGNDDVYFVRSDTQEGRSVVCRFRVADRMPELWDARTGEVRPLTDWHVENGQTVIPLEFTPYGSWFVVFRQPGGPGRARNFPFYRPLTLIGGPWDVAFDPAWGGPSAVRFEALTDWTKRPEPGIRYYSGTANYRTTFDAPIQGTGKRWLDLGQVRELASVTLNGKDVGTVWAPPFRVDVTGLLKPTGNALEVRVTNFWPNRIIGDAVLGTHFTRTNVRQITAKTELMPSGLMGPVRLIAQPETRFR